MIRDDGPGGQGPPGRRPDLDDEIDEGANDLDVVLHDAFRQAFVEDPPLDVGARHLWQLYRRAHGVGVRGPDRYEEHGRLRRVAVSASLSIIIIVFPGLLGQLSLDALPGDFLYPVKRHNETVALSTALSWEDRDQMLVEQAERRLSEAQAVAMLRPSEVLPAVNDVGAIMDELERSPVAATQAQVELIRGDFSYRLAALVDSVSEPAKERIRVAVDEIVTADGIPSPTAAARQVGKTETAVDDQAGDDEHVAMAPQDVPPLASPETDSSASARTSARTSAAPAGVPSSTSASPADAAVPAPTVPSEVAISETEALPSTTTPSTEPQARDTEKCVPAVTQATVPGDASAPATSPAASADAEPAAATADVPGDADESAPSETSADPGSTADACATADVPSPAGPTVDLRPQGPSADDAPSEETDPVTDEDTDMPQTTMDGDGVTPDAEPSPATDSSSARPADDEPAPAPVPRPGRATSEAEPSSPASAQGAAAHADGAPTQPADAAVSATQ